MDLFKKIGKDIITCPVRISYPSVFQPQRMKNAKPTDKPKYSVVCMFEKDNVEHMKCLKLMTEMAKTVMLAKWPDADSRPKNLLQWPKTGVTMNSVTFKDCDVVLNSDSVTLAEANPEYAGHWIVRAATTRRPGIVGRESPPQEIQDEGVIYGGCICRVRMNPYAYSVGGNRGVTWGLNGVQWWEEGDAFGEGRPRTEDLFDSPNSASEKPENYDGDLKVEDGEEDFKL